MSLLINPGYALQFNGISDSVMVPIDDKAIHGQQTSGRKRLPAALSAFTLETWFIPDCGGTIFEQENTMRLSVGSPSSPAPATFEIRLKNVANGQYTIYSLSSARPVTRPNGRIAYWDGILFPAASGMHGSYQATDSEKNDVTALSSGSRELLNVTVTFNRRVISLHVNGEIVATQTLDEEHELVPQQNHIYLGGRGGDFRGTMETVHWSIGEVISGRQQYGALKSDNTIGLWRFEEPIEPISLITTTPSLTASTAANSTFTIGTTAAQALVDELSGQSGLTSIDFTTSPYSGGSYKVTVYASGSSSTVNIPKVPYNILVNPLGYNITTGQPTNKAPERMRLMSIDASAGTVTVESIHLDFSANPTNGRRGILANHDIGRFVIITGDCIVDGGNGNEFQPHGSGTQFSQRQGQVVIDESEFGNHGLMFSLSMAVDSHEYNQFSATTNMGTSFLIGHSGRHTLNHVVSHPFMGTLPPPSSHEVEKKLDASADSITAVFPSQFADVKTMVPVNSVVSSFDTHGPLTVQRIHTSTQVSTFVENGMADIDDSQRELLAIGGPKFNPDLFILKSLSGTDSTDSVKAIIPSKESRIAILEVPKLTDYNYAPFVQVHYNAVDRKGEFFSTVATSRLTVDGTSTVLTLESIKSFGPDGTTIPAKQVIIDGTPAMTAAGSFATIDFAAKTLTFSTATDAAFQVKDTAGAIVQFRNPSPKVMVSKTVPAVSTILSASYSIMDAIRDNIVLGTVRLHSPGGLIEVDTPEMFPFDDGHLEGEDAEGIVAENKLDFSLCPENYLPVTSTDTPQTTPQAINVAQSELVDRESVFHRVLVRTHKVSALSYTEVAGVRYLEPTNGKRSRIGLFVNNAAGYTSGTTTAITVDGVDATTVLETGNRLFKANGKNLGVVTGVTSTTVTISGGGGITEALVDDDELYNQGQVVGRGSTNHSTCVHEYFDIIEHNSAGRVTHLFVQPSDRSRFGQLAKMIASTEKANQISIEYLMSRGRVLSFDEDGNGNSAMLAHGLLSDISSASIYVKGSAAPDSHIVKEIMPGAPVVTMTLGGPGQGAVNTKETWDPSPIARLAWNTRRDCQTAVKETGATTVTVIPLNNRAADLQSWGTYCFPSQGRIYLQLPKNTESERPRFASAAYTSKTGDTFTFTGATGRLGTGDFILGDGTQSDSFSDWKTATSIGAGSTLHLDDKFSEESMCNDGTTINDRLFQTLDTVQHDYQLGTQYASTRALVEIPLFTEQIFGDSDNSVFIGPDNAMKLHIDCTHTAHSWAPNPVGRRFDAVNPDDPEIFGPYSSNISANTHRLGTKIVRQYDGSNHRIYVEDARIFPQPNAPPVTVANLGGSARYRRAFLGNGEWVIYDDRDTTDHYLAIAGSSSDDWIASKDFFRDFKLDATLYPAPGYQDLTYTGIADNPGLISAGYEARRSFYYDRSNVMTQGGNVDYGLRQYVSAIELRAGPRTNPHLPRIKSKRARANVIARVPATGTAKSNDVTAVTQISNGTAGYLSTGTAVATTGGTGSGLKVDYSSIMGVIQPNTVKVNTSHPGSGYTVGDVLTITGGTGDATFSIDTMATVTSLTLDNADSFPKSAPVSGYLVRTSWTESNGTKRFAFYNGRTDNSLTITNTDSNFQPDIDDEILVEEFRTDPASIKYPEVVDGFLNRAWAHPYAPGGLRDGDTVWMNMHYTNPHAIEGLFCKSRGTLNEAEVWTGFNGGQGPFDANPRDSIPMENFLIGDTCIETAQNLVQHINKTIEMNHDLLGRPLPASIVAYVDPYQSTEEFTRILLYDVASDREFIAFQDLWMQVQSSPDAAGIGAETGIDTGLVDNSNSASASRLDVAAGFPSQDKTLISTEQSDFIESSYAHSSTWNANATGAISTHSVEVGDVAKNGYIPRTNEAVNNPDVAAANHLEIESDTTERATFFDTPDGTRVIPAFLAMKGIRNAALDLSNHTESRLQHLDHWTQMDFVRRLTVDLGEISLKEGVADIQSAAIEVVRLINQAAAKNGRTHARRPADQFLGESEKFDLSSPGPKGSAYGGEIDPAASHQHADFAATGSTHDPAPFWDVEKAFASHDRGSHMGYVRAHIGRVVRGGYSIVIHSTIPGASGRNFCVWLDSSRAQTPYQPEYLIGHGGRFRNYWCQPDEMTGENMHPAPMPINRYGRPFAPITTLKEFLPPEEVNDITSNNLSLGPDVTQGGTLNSNANKEMVSGRHSNTLLNESFETKSPSSTLIDGLRVGTRAKARINFGGMTQAGIPGWCPEAGKWGFGRDGDNSRYTAIYGNPSNVSELMVGTSISGVGSADGYIPTDEMDNDKIGDSSLYGIRFVDHLGKSHTIRFVYRQFGEGFANDLTTLPPTMDDETVIYFDDRDVGQGGFSIGRHMVGVGEACGEKTGGTTISKFKGNVWNTYPAAIVGVKVTTALSSGTMTVTLDDPYDGSEARMNSHPDILGYLGFPESGLFQLSTQSGVQGLTFYYTSRTHDDASGTHKFFGVVGGATNHSDGDWFLSPRINFTSVLTDEVIAAAVEFAMKMDNPNSDDEHATTFDCTNMYAPDGKKLKDWGVQSSAIRIRRNSEKGIALSKLFEVSRNEDWGLLDGAASDAAVATHLGGLSTDEINAGTRLDVGYIPRTVLHITTKYRGTNANTATPVLVDSQNNIVDITTWQRNLRGENYTDAPGDRIIPRVDSPSLELHNVAASHLQAASNESWALFGKLATDDANSWGEPFTIWYGTTAWAKIRSQAGSNPLYNAEYLDNGKGPGFNPSNQDIVFKGYNNAQDVVERDGIRRAGSKNSSPFLYFRGARDSPDHWVPLYFGGGFSGAVVDINDGTQNDYADFYTHPYSGGPTGSAGFQNVGELAGSYALVDTNAMMAMFPGTPYLDQHKGQNNMPFFNQDGLLPFDMAKATNTKATGIDYDDASNSVSINIPSPIILRFAHPHARYSATGETTDSTTYMIFGPGQAFPHNTAAFEPQGSDIVTTGNGYSAVPIYIGGDPAFDSFLPNQLANGDATHHSGLNRLSSQSAHLPMTTFFQLNNLQGFNYLMNWQPTKGFPNEKCTAALGYSQTLSDAFYYEGSNHPVITILPNHAHPFNFIFSGLAGTPEAGTVGTASHPKTRASAAVWHMDGGYHPGGHFLDNHVNLNPKHPVTNTRLATGSGVQRNVTAFRPCGLLSKAYLSFYGGTPDNQEFDENVVVIDATRVQNAEELGTILAASVNTFPGKDPLKAIGGTFMPSMQSAHKQDRYGWVEFDYDSSTVHDDLGPAAATITVSGGPGLTNIPQYGWLRISDGAAHVGYAPYIKHVGNTFTLAVNPIVPVTATTNIVNPATRTEVLIPPGPVPNLKVYVWTKAGTHRYNNASAPGTRDHMCQVHFSGYIDAVDRTRPIGAVGWSGEAYSYLNSYEPLAFGTPGTNAAGLGAWHPFLGFSPYGAAETCYSSNAPSVVAEAAVNPLASDSCVTGLSSRHLVAITHESELPLIAKADRDGILAMGDWLMAKETANMANGGTVKWDTGKVHNKSRYSGPATAGPHVEAQMHNLFDRPTVPADYPASGSAPTDAQWHRAIQSGDMVQATSCLHPTGDLFWDESVQKGSNNHELTDNRLVECFGISNDTDYLNINAVTASMPHPGLFGYYDKRHAARNFSAEHIVWKRMDGGNLTMPAVNARGLGMVPWVKRKDGANYKTVGEKVLGNVRFSFETTNAAMFPIIQAQELGHPQLAEQHPLEIKNALLIPNEDQQFKSLQVVDDTGQEHRIEGGSPFGTVILDFRHISDREVEGLAPALAGAGVNPNLRIRLPEPDEIPGNVIIRPGFDRIQAYQNETFGSGGLQHPAQNITNIRQMFNNDYSGPRLWPTWENNGWEHLSQDATDISTAQSNSRLKFPASTSEGWSSHSGDSPLNTAYEPHDRSLFFHVTRMGVSMTHRYDVDELDFNSQTGTTLTAGSAPEAATWQDASEQSGGRWFLRVYDPTTDKGVLASYTGVSGSNFTGVVLSPDFTSFVSGKTGLKIVPSYYMPAGSTRFFAARRLRDHSEYSGASPDMKRIDWYDLFTNLPSSTGVMETPSQAYTRLTKPKMTPMPIPRMGHHYVTPTMALLPGHYAHPAYQRMYDLHHACRSSNYAPTGDSLVGIREVSRDADLDDVTIYTHEPLRDSLIWFSTPTATYGPSDVHGGAFTLLTETKIKYEGYGIAASLGVAGTTNSEGGHSLVLEAAASYTLNNHFPDPLEVGAYQIIIQPNVFKQQLKGFHLNHSEETKSPSEAGDKVTELTGQQINTVIAIEDDAGTDGAYTLILAEAMMADVRGCEVIINEVMLDIEPDAGSQFTNLPPLALYNPLGVQETSSPSFTRRSLPYRPGMFTSATPGYTLTIPWWGILHKDGATAAAAQKWRHLEWHKPDNYYELCRASYGCIGAQLTLAGYPTTYLDIYEPHKRLRSLNPNCVVLANNGSSEITVDDNALFPVVPYYGEVLEYTRDGIRYTATYANRTGTLAHATLGESTKFSGVVGSTAFWNNLQNNTTILRLSRPYDTVPADKIYTDSSTSITTRILPQLSNGSRDTNSLHVPDAYLCLWHPNLGRPFTWYSDDASRGFYDKTGVADTPVDQKGYNHIPEHFETIHYQDFNYVASKGPFGLAMNWIVPPGGGTPPTNVADGLAHTAAGIDLDATLSHQGGTDENAFKYNFAGFWPSGSYGGGSASRLESYGHALIGWGSDTYGMDCETYQDSTGVATLTLPTDRNRCFGYRMGVRQAYNRPRWSPYVRGWLEVANSNALLGYYHGPLIQHDSKTNGWDYVGADGGQSDVDFDTMYVGILERITQISSLLGQDQIGRQVRYSDGRRMTAPYGCTVRTLRNADTVKRLYPGDDKGKNIVDLADAHRYYMVDWWGNTRGEDVRRFPVRGFGIRPSWDPEDAYADTNVTHRPTAHDLFGGDGTDRYSGSLNDMNNDATNMNRVDWFNPASALRVGDRGDGRGCRWPTVFNESLLMAVSENHDATGLVLSHSTSEPVFGQGLVRPSNLTLQDGEIERGISDRVDLNSDDGLLKPSAHVGEGFETVNADTRGAEPVSRDDVRLGLDVDTIAELNDGKSREYVVMSTEAASLHTDREVGQRTNIRGAHDAGGRTLKDLDMTALDWSAQPVTGVVRHSNAHAFWPLGGTYVMEWSKYAGNLDVKDWGQEIPESGMVLWLKADALDLEDGDAVTSWKSSGPIDFEFTQGTASAQPSYIASSGIINNMPAIDCDGNDSLSLNFDARLNTAEMTVFVVAWIDSDDGNIHGIVESRVTASGVNSGFNMYIRADSHKDYQFWSGGNTGWNVADSALNSLTAGAAKVLTGMLEGGDGVGSVGDTSLYVDGTLADTANAAYWVAPSSNYNLGRVPSSFYLNGKIAEVIQYNRALSESERKQVEGYLATKYGLSVSHDVWAPSNPYQDNNHQHPTHENLNHKDSTIGFIYRPSYGLDFKHTQMFRPYVTIIGPQAGANFYRATAGGKYGMFVSDVPSARTGTPSNPPYAPVYSIDPDAPTVPVSQGPKIQGVDVTGYDKTDIRSPVARTVMSENTLEHFRADASRRSGDDDDGDYSVQPRHSQTLHPKGSDGDASYNTGDHSGE